MYFSSSGTEVGFLTLLIRLKGNHILGGTFMNITEEKPTLNELKEMKGFNAAETLAIQSKIFNCSLEETWDRHIHKAIHRANSKEEIINIAKHILHFEARDAVRVVKKNTVFISEGYQYSFNSIYKDQESKILVRYTLIHPGRYKLEVFRDNRLIYKHKELGCFCPSPRKGGLRDLPKNKSPLKGASLCKNSAI